MKKSLSYYFFIAILLFILGLLGYVWYESHQYAKRNTVVEVIQVSGTNAKVRQEIQSSLKEIINHKMSNIDIYDVRAKVLANPRIQNASVAKIFPNTIAIKVIEQKPLFIWQNNNDEFYIVNSENKVLRKAKLEEYKKLILIQGDSLPIEASDEIRFYVYGNSYLLDLISTIRYMGYRWDLILHNGIVIKLPEENIPQALDFIVRMDKKYQILNRKISYIDARVHRKIFIKPEQKL